MTYASSDELVAYLRLPSGAEDPTLLDVALEGADAAIDGYLDQEGGLLTQTETDAYFDGSGNSLLVLPAFPVTSVTTLTVYSDRTPTASSEVLVANTDYVLDGPRGLVHRIDGSVFTKGRQNIKVTYVHGTAAESLDAGVKVVALQVATRIYEIGMVENESVGGVSTTWVKGAGSLTADEKDALHRLRIGGP